MNQDNFMVFMCSDLSLIVSHLNHSVIMQGNSSIEHFYPAKTFSTSYIWNIN